VPVHAMGVTVAQAQDSVDYIASDPDEFERAMADLNVDRSQFTFVDIGCGKGRALMMAARQPWKRLIGIEFSASLCAVARTNLARVAADQPVEIRCQDARDFEPPPGPLVLFLYNPFGYEPMRVVADRVKASFDAAPRQIFVVYTNPFHAVAWPEAGFRERARGELHTIFSLDQTVSSTD